MNATEVFKLGVLWRFSNFGFVRGGLQSDVLLQGRLNMRQSQNWFSATPRHGPVSLLFEQQQCLHLEK